MGCNLCGTKKKGRKIFDFARAEQRNILKCPECGLVYLETGMTQAEAERFYREEYRKVDSQPIQTPEQHYSDPVTIKDAKSQFEFIAQNTRIEGKKILEIGSASGHLMELLSLEGAEVEGIELNDEFRAFSKDRGFTTYSIPVENLAHRGKHYDVIVAFHVLEHFIDPKTSINSICTCTQRRGKFMGEVPNENEWGITIFNSEIVKRLHYNPYHYYYFAPGTLTEYLQEAGFGYIHITSVERYNSLAQLRQILEPEEKEPEEIIRSCVFPKSKNEDLRLRVGDEAEQKFNTMFAHAVNNEEELNGNCLRFVCNRQ